MSTSGNEQTGTGGTDQGAGQTGTGAGQTGTGGSGLAGTGGAGRAAAGPGRPRNRGVAIAVGILGLVFVLAGSTALVGQAIGRTERSTRTFSGVRDIRVDTESGDVRLVAGAREDVRVEVAAEQSWRRPKVEQTLDGGTLRLRGDCRLWLGRCSVSFRLEVPARTPVDLHTGSGEVRIAGLAAAADLRSGSGDVTARDVTGPVAAQTGSGEILVRRVRGDVTASSGSGDVTGADVDARRVQARSGSGDVELVMVATVPDQVSATSGSGDVQVTVPDAVYRVDAHSGSGETSLSLRQDPAAPRTIIARTGSGDISVLAS